MCAAQVNTLLIWASEAVLAIHIYIKYLADEVYETF